MIQRDFQHYLAAFSASPTIVDLLRERARTRPDHSAFRFVQDAPAPEKLLTYAELDQRARAIAARLSTICKPGERVLLVYPPGLDFVTAFFGCLYAGAIAVPLPPPSSTRTLGRVEAVAASAQPTAGLGTQQMLRIIQRRSTPESTLSRIAWLSSDEIADEHAGDWQHPAVDAAALAYLQYTSGSTGTPKGVKISHGNLAHNAALIADAWQITPDDLHVLWMPAFHDFGLVAGIIATVYSDSALVILSPLSVMFRPVTWLSAITHYRATISGGMNFGFEQCVRAIAAEERGALDLSSLRVMYSGGEMIYAETLDRFARTFAAHGFGVETLRPAYGLAETTLLVTSTRAPRADFPPTRTLDKALLERGTVKLIAPGSATAKTVLGCGAALGDQQVLVVDPETGRVCTSEQVGEIWVRGASVAQGYWNDPAATAAAFEATLTGHSGTFLRTGDLGFQHDGELFITGRLKEMIIIRGRNIYPHDIEQSVERSHPALRVGNGAVFSIERGVEEQLVVAYEIERDSSDHEQIARAIRQTIAEEWELKPQTIVLIEAGTIPKTSSGKIARKACRDALLNESLRVVHAWSQSPPAASDHAAAAQPDQPQHGRSAAEISAWLAEHVAAQLAVAPDEIDPAQNFASYGLDSIDIVRILRELEQWVGAPVTPTIAWDYPSIAQLARFLAGASPQPTPVPRAATSLDAAEPIAVIGLGCRFPGAANVAAFLDMLREGRDAVMEAPADRWNLDALYDPEPGTPGKMYTRRGSFLEQVDRFDPFFFGISPREATTMDPQQRLMLEVAWEALEHAAQAPDRISGSRTGVFVGISTNDYYQLQLKQEQPAQLDMYAGTGNALTIAANRLSYLLNLRGPSLAIDTACSSSLVAIHLACQSLRTGESDMALAGGVSLILTPELSIVFSNQRVLAADGRCKTFDAAADGYARGEGCGLVVLKRLSDAVAHGDQVLALIRGSAVNQDGRSNGLTAPNGLAQQALLNDALAQARLAPSDLGYIEAHGTGTRLGDPIEVEALTAVLAQAPVERPCLLGSVKTNIGHLEAAAGVAGLIKVVLSLQHSLIFPHLHLDTLNPYIRLEHTRLRIPSALEAWADTERPRIAGVSAFAFGGTNAHVILEAAAPATSQPDPRPEQLLLLSAKTEAALDMVTENLVEHLRQHPDLDLADVAYTLQVGRAALPHRRVLACRDRDDALATFAAGDRERILSGVAPPASDERPVAFLFPGQGAQQINMGLGLYQSEPIFRACIDQCAELLTPHLDLDLREIIYPQPDAAEAAAEQLRQTRLTQPALFVIEYALAQQWIAWGVQPAAMIGHSIGEYVAACLAGVLSLEQALVLVAARGRLMQQLAGGAMLVLTQPLDNVEPLLGSSLSLAAVNDTKQCVVSGPHEAIDALAAYLKEEGRGFRRLETSHAFHSAMMDPILDAFTREVAQITLRPPRIPYVSNLTGTWITPEQATDPAYYAQHLRQAVRFADGLREILSLQADHPVLEVGPGHALSALAKRHPARTKQHRLLASLPTAPEQGSDRSFMLHSLGQLWLSGVAIRWSDLHAEQRRRVTLPTYPFERQRYWIGPAAASPAQAQDQPSQPGDWLSTPAWKRTLPPPIDLSDLPAKTWLILADEHGIGAAVAERLRERGQRVLTVRHGPKWSRPADEQYVINAQQAGDYDALIAALFTQGTLPEQIVYAWSISAASSDPLDTSDLTAAQSRCFESVLLLAQALEKQKITSAIQLSVLSTGVHSVTGDEQLQPANALLLGVARVISQEYPHITCRAIDLVLPSTDQRGRLAERLLAELLAESADTVIAYRGMYRWTRTLEPTTLPTDATEPTLRPGGTYLITGGLGGIGLALAEALARTQPVKLALLGRSGLPERDGWQQWLAEHDQNDPISARISRVQALHELGSEVMLVRADTSDPAQMRAALDEIGARLGPINGVIHAAGVGDVARIRHITPESAARVLAPKVAGTFVLASLLDPAALDFFVLCSSIAALVGGFGLASYAAANAVLDTFASDYTARTGRRCVSINWDLWLDTGMTTQFIEHGSAASLQQRYLVPEQGVAIFKRVLAAHDGPTQIVVSKRAAASLLAAQQIGGDDPAASGDRVQRLATRPRPELRNSYAAPGSETERMIAEVWQNLLGIAQVGLDDNFFDLGGDSLVGTQVVNYLKRELNIDIATVLLFENPTIRALIRVIDQAQQASSADAETVRVDQYRDKVDKRKKFMEQRRGRGKQ